MNVATIQMEPAEAKEKLKAYRDHLAGRHNQAVEQEFSAIELAYQELAKGTPLIDARSVIRDCGWRSDGRPVLAFGRADQRFVQWQIGHDSRRWDANARTYTGKYAPMHWIFKARKLDGWGDKQRSRNLTFTIVDILTDPPAEPKNGVAMVPLVPPGVYPQRGLDLSKHFILWEVESWDAKPPIDPMLLKPIGGDLYAVIGQWDLTPIERAIIAGTRR